MFKMSVMSRLVSWYTIKLWFICPFYKQMICEANTLLTFEIYGMCVERVTSISVMYTLNDL